MSEDPQPGYISLRDAAKYSGCYSQDYLKLRAKQGKLKAVKIARNWLTTKEWIDEYLERVKGKRIGASDRGEDKKIEDQLEKEKYISLKQATKFCSYSQDYLSLRAGQGKLKATKIGRNWVTKKEWVDNYLRKVKGEKAQIFDRAKKEKEIEIKIPKQEFISLKEAADYSNYSQDYLSLRARQGKLKATKLGRNWVTKKEWLGKYIKKVNDYKNWTANRKPATTTQITTPTYQPVSPRAIAVVVALVFVLASVGTLFAYPYFEPAVSSIVGQVKEITSDIGEGIVETGENLELGIAFIGKGVNEVFNELTQYITQDIRAIKKGFQILGQKTKQVPQKVVSVFRGRETISREDFGLKQKKENIGKFARDIGENIRYKISLAQKFVTRVIQRVVKGAKLLVRIVDESGRFIGSKFGDAYRFITQSWRQKAAERQGVPKEKLLPKPEKEGVIVIPSSEKDEEIKQKIKASFSDEVRVTPRDKTSGIIIPKFREREGQEYLYIMVPVNE